MIERDEFDFRAVFILVPIYVCMHPVYEYRVNLCENTTSHNRNYNKCQMLFHGGYSFYYILKNKNIKK